MNILELENSICEMKNSLDGLNSRLYIIEERMSQLQDKD